MSKQKWQPTFVFEFTPRNVHGRFALAPPPLGGALVGFGIGSSVCRSEVGTTRRGFVKTTKGSIKLEKT